MKADLTTVNIINTRLVMQVLYEKGPVSRAEISKSIDLSLPSVMKITDNLIQRDLITEVGKGVSTGGKPPDLVDIKKYSYYSIGIKLSKRHYNCGIINLRGDIIMSRTQLIEDNTNEQAIINGLIHFIENILKRANVDKSKYLGIAICIDGEINSEQGIIIKNRDLPLKNVCISGIIQEKVGIRTYLLNTIHAKILSEKWFGLFPKSNNYLFINFDDNINSALVLNNDLFKTGKYILGNIAHFTINVNGPRCYCGSYGCLNTYFNEVNIINAYQSELKNGRCKRLLARIEEINSLKIDQILSMILDKDLDAIAIFNDFLSYIVNTVDCLYKTAGFEYIICSGKYILKNNVLFEQFQTLMEKQCGSHMQNLTIYRTKMENSSTIGAAALLFTKLLESGCNLDVLRGEING